MNSFKYTDLHCIYVPKKSFENFTIGLNKKIWGFKKNTCYVKQIKKGDYILFAYHLKPEEKDIRNTFLGKLQQFVLAQATSDIFTVNLEINKKNPCIWKDEASKNIYIHRFKFKTISSYPTLPKNTKCIHTNSFFTLDKSKELENTLYEALRYSTVIQGKNGLLEKVKINPEKTPQSPLNLKDFFDFFDFSECKISPKIKKPKPKPRSGSFEDLDDDLKDIQNSPRSETEKKLLILARKGQGKYRKNLLKVFEFCPLTNFKLEKLLIASHIKPWRDSNDIERLDHRNGLLLSALMDKLFDNYFISFEPESLAIQYYEDDETIKSIVDLHKLHDFHLEVSYKDKDLIQFKEYMKDHYNKYLQKKRKSNKVNNKKII